MFNDTAKYCHGILKTTINKLKKKLLLLLYISFTEKHSSTCTVFSSFVIFVLIEILFWTLFVGYLYKAS